MYRSLVFLLAIAPAVDAQQPLEGVTRSVDTFTGDTVWQTKYGRLDEIHGCGRSSVAIIWNLLQVKGAPVEQLEFHWVDVDGPFHHSDYAGALEAAVNIDGEIIEGQRVPLSSHLGGDRKLKEEVVTFNLPDGTLRKIAEAKAPKMRVVGSNKTCDGIVEVNMRTRLSVLLAYLDHR